MRTDAERPRRERHEFISGQPGHGNTHPAFPIKPRLGMISEALHSGPTLSFPNNDKKGCQRVWLEGDGDNVRSHNLHSFCVLVAGTKTDLLDKLRGTCRTGFGQRVSIAFRCLRLVGLQSDDFKADLIAKVVELAALDGVTVAPTDCHVRVAPGILCEVVDVHVRGPRETPTAKLGQRLKKSFTFSIVTGTGTHISNPASKLNRLQAISSGLGGGGQVDDDGETAAWHQGTDKIPAPLSLPVP